VDSSSTTITSPISFCRATDSTALAIDSSSFLAGIIAETKFLRAAPRPGWEAIRFRFADGLIIKRVESSLKRNLKSGIVLTFIAALLILFAMPEYRQGEASLRGRREIDFQFTADGQPRRLSELRGNVVVLNFWATWCPPCVDEAPSLNRLQQKIAPRGGTVIGVSADEDQSAYQNFLKAYSVDYPTFRDPSKKIQTEYGTVMIPETYVITRDGKIDRKIVGAQDWASPDITSYLDSLLSQK
jgi:cytochrome c biogenesis protein CcmG, thiol:disulfide interchange protein DsbE